MSLEMTFAILIAVGLVGLSLLEKLFSRKQPKEAFFKCARCGVTTRHNERTVTAWRNHKKKFFCQICHTKWLESQPSQQHSSDDRINPRSGCLGAIVILVIIPLFYLFF